MTDHGETVEFAKGKRTQWLDDLGSGLRNATPRVGMLSNGLPGTMNGLGP